MASSSAPAATRAITIALVGNPNTGKTTLFNALAGMRQRVGNYPGVTVETKKGQFHHQGRSFDLVDLPGTYSLAARSPDEMVAVDLILGHQAGEPRPDVVLSIVDASNLERNLYLTTQVLELGVPVVVALNMVDVAAGQGVRLDAERLRKQLGVPVVPIQANKGKGLDDLRQALADACDRPQPPQGPAFPSPFEAEVKLLCHNLGAECEPFLARRLLLDVGGYTEQRLEERHADLKAMVNAARQRLNAAGCGVPAVEARARYGWIREHTAGCIHRPAERPVTWTDRIDRVLTHKLWGTLAFALLMLIVFVSIFILATPLMELIDAGKGVVADLVGSALHAGPLRSLLVDGVIQGVGGVIIFLPQILILFFFIALLEDCGYMARAAFLMDKLMSRCGLNGKSFIPMLSSVACAIPGVMAARVIENRRDRLATILVAPLMSCSARLPVYALLIGAFLTEGHPIWLPGVTMFAMYAIGLIVAPLVALTLKSTILRGETPAFVMEMPVYKLPSLTLVLRRMVDSGWAFVRRAGTVILACMVVVWALLYFPATNADGQRYEDLIAAAEERVEKERAQIKELEEPIAAQQQEIGDIKEALKGKPHLTNLYGLLGLSLAEQESLKQRKAEIEEEIKPVTERVAPLQEKVDAANEEVNALRSEWKAQSILGRAGHWIEPAVAPLGWDWRLGMAALASFPAREVVVGTLGIIYGVGEGAGEEDDEDNPSTTKLGTVLQKAKRADGTDLPAFSVPVALSVMVFFALCCQCASTLAVIRRETNSWRWPVFTFVYMTALAYLGALLVYQIGSRLG